MRTKASVKGHPIHPMLIPFPIAFLVGAFIFDLLGILMDKPGFWQTGAYLAVAGVISAFIAAIPGTIDYFFTVPPKSTGHSRATKHMLVNLSATIIFLIAVIIRAPFDIEPGAVILILELAGLVFLGMGGWMGGTLVERNFIGPDHRYPNAGKWKEISVSAEAGKPAAVAKIDELKKDQMKLVKINGKRIVLAKTEDGYAAFDDSCTHRGGSLAGGIMICNTVQCFWHGSQFDVKTGEVKSGPAEKKIKTYDVEIKGNEVLITL